MRRITHRPVVSSYASCMGYLVVVGRRPFSSTPAKGRATAPTEPVIDITDVQGDVILGFNKAYDLRVVVDLTYSPDGTPAAKQKEKALKQWIKTTLLPKLTSTDAVRAYRDTHKGSAGYKVDPTTVFLNAAFSFDCVKTLLSTTTYKDTLTAFNSVSGIDSSFQIGASNRSWALNDDPSTWEFGGNANNAILLNFSSDTEATAQAAAKDLLSSVTTGANAPLSVANSTVAYHGDRTGDAAFMYSHEHYGFQDGLSQPEVRGLYKNGSTTTPIVKRYVDPSDPRSTQFAAPGYQLLDTGRFLLGKDYAPSDAPVAFPETNYPDWCRNGSFIVYRKLSQDVAGFWNEVQKAAVDCAKLGGIANPTDEQKKQIAGVLAAKLVGRWWDGTPLTHPEPLTKWQYPPPLGTPGIDFRQAAQLRWEKNGFGFEGKFAPWPIVPSTPGGQPRLIKGDAPDGSFSNDKQASSCPFAAHIRKIYPRDESTDQGVAAQTDRRRVVRRGNNYGPRVKDVFNAAGDTNPRGLDLVMYMGSIQDQFEFLQGTWSNSSTVPREGGDDVIIGLRNDSPRFAKISNIKLPNGKVLDSYQLSTPAYFTKAVGMGYFLLPPISSVRTYLAADPVS